MKISLTPLGLLLLATSSHAAPAALDTSALEPVAIEQRQATSCGAAPPDLGGYRLWRIDNFNLGLSGSDLSKVSFDVAQSATGSKSITCTREKSLVRGFSQGSQYDCGKFQADNYEFSYAGNGQTGQFWLGHDSLR